MSTLGYAQRLSDYDAKGACGAPEIFESERVVRNKIKKLTELFRSSKYVVVHTGAGISTSVNLPDFRGPNGVWTLEQKNQQPTKLDQFEHVAPSLTHMALLALYKAGYVKYIVTQNVDGLHTKSGFPRESLSELHGNIFTEICTKCGTEIVREYDTKGCGLKSTGRICTQPDCRGALRDFVLDWEDELPVDDLNRSEEESRRADLCLCLGTSLQILPSADIPFLCKKNKGKGKVVICNLQKTPRDCKADLVIHTYVDDVMRGLMGELGLSFPLYQTRCRFKISLAVSQEQQELTKHEPLYICIAAPAASKPQVSPILANNVESSLTSSNDAPLLSVSTSSAPESHRELKRPAPSTTPNSAFPRLVVPVDVLGRRGSFCIQSLGPGEDAPDDPPPFICRDSEDQNLSLTVPTTITSAQPPSNEIRQNFTIEVESLDGGPLVYIQSIEAQRLDTSVDAWESFTTVRVADSFPHTYKHKIGNDSLNGRIRIHFYEKSDVPSMTFLYRIAQETTKSNSTKGSESTPWDGQHMEQTTIYFVPNHTQFFDIELRTVDYNTLIAHGDQLQRKRQSIDAMDLDSGRNSIKREKTINLKP